MWDPYLQKDIDKIEKCQRQAARFVTGDYQSRNPGCVSQMLRDARLPPLQDRRKANRLVFFYKVVEGLLPAIPSQDFLIPIRANKRKIIPKQFDECVSNNIIERQSINNSKCYQLMQCKNNNYKQSFFPKTLIDWTKLEENVVCADSVNSFKRAVLPQCD